MIIIEWWWDILFWVYRFFLQYNLVNENRRWLKDRQKVVYLKSDYKWQRKKIITLTFKVCADGEYFTMKITRVKNTSILFFIGSLTFTIILVEKLNFYKERKMAWIVTQFRYMDSDDSAWGSYVMISCLTVG